MRLRAIMQRPDSIRDIAQNLSLFGKLCAVRLKRDIMQIVMVNPITGTQIWVALDPNEYFGEMDIATAASGVISLELYSDTLFRALKSCTRSGVDVVRMKLIKRQDIPYLIFSVEQNSRNGTGSTTISQQVPVRICHPSEGGLLEEPSCPEPTVVVVLKHEGLSIVRICDRYRHLSSRITVAANSSGDLHLCVENDNVRVDTAWANLETAEQLEGNWDDRPTQRPTPQLGQNEMAHAKVDAKELWNAFKIHSSAEKILLCICHNHALILFVFLTGQDEGSLLTYFLTATNQE
ncbi:checkpoint protein Hus1/Mec3 [Lipomyces japonicus]|uniref:checkpoint protein Hus1/Mec3 n=1 Tax=Lipomyces japonicus TaxID=56871 RepID=UPI0034CE1C2D